MRDSSGRIVVLGALPGRDHIHRAAHPLLLCKEECMCKVELYYRLMPGFLYNEVAGSEWLTCAALGKYRRFATYTVHPRWRGITLARALSSAPTIPTYMSGSRNIALIVETISTTMLAVYWQLDVSQFPPQSDSLLPAQLIKYPHVYYINFRIGLHPPWYSKLA